MKLHFLVLAALASVNAPAVLAADAPATASTSIAGMFRLLKANGTTVVSQAIVAPGAMAQIGVKASDAIAAANGRCAFNGRIDEVSPLAPILFR